MAPLAFPSTMAFAVVETHLYLDISGFGWISVVGFCPCVSGFGLCIDRCYASSQTENRERHEGFGMQWPLPSTMALAILFDRGDFLIHKAFLATATLACLAPLAVRQSTVVYYSVLVGVLLTSAGV